MCAFLQDHAKRNASLHNTTEVGHAIYREALKWTVEVSVSLAYFISVICSKRLYNASIYFTKVSLCRFRMPTVSSRVSDR